MRTKIAQKFQMVRIRCQALSRGLSYEREGDAYFVLLLVRVGRGLGKVHFTSLRMTAFLYRYLSPTQAINVWESLSFPS